MVSAPFLLLVTAVGYAVSSLTLMTIKDEEVPADQADRRPLFSEIKEGLRFVMREPFLQCASKSAHCWPPSTASHLDRGNRRLNHRWNQFKERKKPNNVANAAIAREFAGRVTIHRASQG